MLKAECNHEILICVLPPGKRIIIKVIALIPKTTTTHTHTKTKKKQQKTKTKKNTKKKKKNKKKKKKKHTHTQNKQKKKKQKKKKKKQKKKKNIREVYSVHSVNFCHKTLFFGTRDLRNRYT